MIENLGYLGNPLSFTNAAVWPKRQAFRIIADSNLDWGQNRDKIVGWLRERRLSRTHLDPVHLLPGHNTFSVNEIAGVFDFERHRWLREHADPRGHFGHTYLWFDVSNELADRFMNEQRHLRPEATAGQWCPPELEYERHGPGSKVRFVRDEAPEPGATWVVCVEVRKGCDLGLRSLVGQLRFGRLTARGRCRTELVEESEEAWYRLDRGVHGLCAEEIPNRRAYLPYYYEGQWLVRNRGTGLNLRRMRLPDAR
jgi:hypothetical protein